MVSPPLPLGHNIDYNMAQRVFGGEGKVVKGLGAVEKLLIKKMAKERAGGPPSS